MRLQREWDEKVKREEERVKQELEKDWDDRTRGHGEEVRR